LQAERLELPPLPVYKTDQASPYPLAKHNTGPQLWISRVDAEARQLSSGDEIKIYNERGEFGAKAPVTDDMPPGVVWIRDGWFGLNHLTSGDRF
jgi:anaerobic selenocysteine-containing dehydrogenase